MLDNKKVSIVIPCRNEENGIGRVLGGIPAFADEIIVVDNGSDDNTARVAAGFNIKVMREIRRGYGSALLKGIESSQGQIIGCMDGDGTYAPNSLEDLAKHMLRHDSDFVSGCRFPLTAAGSMGWLNRFANYFISWLIRVLSGIPLRDSQSGMFVFKKDILRKFRITNMQMGFSQEIKIKSWIYPGLKCHEVHIPYQPRIGKTKFRMVSDSLGNLAGSLALAIKVKMQIKDFSAGAG